MSHIVKICPKHGNLTKDKCNYGIRKGINRKKTKTYIYYSYSCRQCRTEAVKKYKNENKKLYLEKVKKYNQSERVKNLNHASTIKRKFGIDYQEMFNKQNGVCAVCKNPEITIDKRYNRIKRLSVDHNHKTGKFRELLCNRCNVTIGAVQESIDILLRLIKYLKKHN